MWIALRPKRIVFSEHVCELFRNVYRNTFALKTTLIIDTSGKSSKQLSKWFNFLDSEQFENARKPLQRHVVVKNRDSSAFLYYPSNQRAHYLLTYPDISTYIFTYNWIPILSLRIHSLKPLKNIENFEVGVVTLETDFDKFVCRYFKSNVVREYVNVE